MFYIYHTMWVRVDYTSPFRLVTYYGDGLDGADGSFPPRPVGTNNCKAYPLHPRLLEASPSTRGSLH